MGGKRGRGTHICYPKEWDGRKGTKKEVHLLFWGRGRMMGGGRGGPLVGGTGKKGKKKE